jgi:hypothetical protein
MGIAHLPKAIPLSGRAQRFDADGSILLLHLSSSVQRISSFFSLRKICILCVVYSANLRINSLLRHYEMPIPLCFLLFEQQDKANERLLDASNSKYSLLFRMKKSII